MRSWDTGMDYIDVDSWRIARWLLLEMVALLNLIDGSKQQETPLATWRCLV